MSDEAIVAVQLGRPPRGNYSVAARCMHGLPAVIRTAPFLKSGEPFPTLYWLTCPAAVRACGRLESEGFMRAMNDRLELEEDLATAYEGAHAAYVQDRNSGGALPGDPGAGGMPNRVKCLHALYAHEAATGSNPIGAIVREMIEPLDCPGPCVVDGAAVPHHPHMRNR